MIHKKRYWFWVFLATSLMGCSTGSTVEQVTFSSVAEGVLDMPEKEVKGNDKPATAANNLHYQDASVALAEADTVHIRGYRLSFLPATDTTFSPYFPDQEKRDALSAKELNWYKATLLVEQYLREQEQQPFTSTDSTLTLILEDGTPLLLARRESNPEEGEETSYAYEHYFPETGFFLLRTQFAEGNCWLLLNRKTGKKSYISGLPYFSPNGRKLVAGNLDLEAGYSFNGLAMYTLLADSLALDWELEISNWGPRSISWESDTSLLVEKSYWEMDGNNAMRWREAATRLTITQTAPQN